MLYVAVPWRKSEEGGGVVRVAVPYEQVKGVTRAFRRLVLFGSLFGFAAAGLVSNLAARWISGPVEELRPDRVADRVARGRPGRIRPRRRRARRRLAPAGTPPATR